VKAYVKETAETIETIITTTISPTTRGLDDWLLAIFSFTFDPMFRLVCL
jgi:hypothetical protein